MSSTLTLDAVFSRTQAGEAELSSPSNGLSLNQRKLLQWSDGQVSVAEMAERLAAGHTVDASKVIRDVERMQSMGLLSNPLSAEEIKMGDPQQAQAYPSIAGLYMQSRLGCSAAIFLTQRFVAN